MNNNICLHKKISWKIKNIIFSSTIISTALFINIFHIPFPLYHGIELEKIEFGIIILCSLIGILKLKIIIISSVLLPLLDLLLHGHYVPNVLPEMLSNILIIISTYIFWKIFLENNKKIIFDILFLFFIILTTLLIRTLHYYIIILMFWNKTLTSLIYTIIPIFIIASIKYFIIFLTMILIKKKIKNIDIYKNK